MTEATPVVLAACPFCGQQLTRSTRKINVAARCETEDCWMSDRRITVLLDDPIQVAQWNTRTPPPVSAAPGTPAPKSDSLASGPVVGATYTYKGNAYHVLGLDEQRLMQFEDQWQTAVEYRCEPDNGLRFYRAITDFRAKFAALDATDISSEES